MEAPVNPITEIKAKNFVVIAASVRGRRIAVNAFPTNESAYIDRRDVLLGGLSCHE
jgi:hypothetical protein